MDSIISCRINRQGNHNFYIEHNGKQYYLFTQEYHRGVNIYFSSGVSLRRTLNIRTAKDHCVQHTIEKLTPYIKYVEEENEIRILERKEHDRRKNMTYNDCLDYDYEDIFLNNEDELTYQL